MLDFHVTKTIFDLTKKGYKTHEYREYKPYWIKRLEHLNPPLMANIVEGYSDKKIPVTIIKINSIKSSEVPPIYRIFVINTRYCYDIEYKER